MDRMKVGYTEFSFGYGFTENLIRSSLSAPTGAPVFPHLVQEARLGYDVRIDFPAVPQFYQYKLPELMKRNTAFEITGGLCPGLTVSFFRIALMRRDLSRQHQHLIDWESCYPGNVFYAAPCLETTGTFNSAYNACAVHQRSVLFSPTDIGPLPDNKVHTIAYKSGLPVGYFCSEPRSVKALAFDGLGDRLRAQFDDTRYTDCRSVARELRQNVLEGVSPVLRRAAPAMERRIRQALDQPRRATPPTREEQQVRADLLLAREISRIGFGLDLMIAQPKA